MKALTQLAFGVFSLIPASQFADPAHSIVVPYSSLLKTPLSITGEDEVVVIEHLMQTMEDQLQVQQHLKEIMIRFKQLKEAFIQGDQTKRNASAMVRSAREILEIITNQHLEFHFSKDYLDELTLFSSIAGKNGIKRP